MKIIINLLVYSLPQKFDYFEQLFRFLFRHHKQALKHFLKADLH